MMKKRQSVRDKRTTLEDRHPGFEIRVEAVEWCKKKSPLTERASEAVKQKIHCQMTTDLKWSIVYGSRTF